MRRKAEIETSYGAGIVVRQRSPEATGNHDSTGAPGTNSHLLTYQGQKVKFGVSVFTEKNALDKTCGTHTCR